MEAMTHTEKEERADVTHTRCNPLQMPPKHRHTLQPSTDRPASVHPYR